MQHLFRPCRSVRLSILINNMFASAVTTDRNLFHLCIFLQVYDKSHEGRPEFLRCRHMAFIFSIFHKTASVPAVPVECLSLYFPVF